MVRLFLLGVLPLGLAACAQWSGPPAWRSEAPAAHYDFDWQLSGDPAIAPLQVFSGAGHTWLQYAPGRTPPAVFAQTPAGLKPLPHVRREPYIVVEGIWPALVLQGGRHAARVERRQSTSMPGPRAAQPGLPDLDSPAGASVDAVPAPALPASNAAEIRAASSLPPADVRSSDAPPADTPPPEAPLAQSFRAGPSDTTLRAVLARWAAHAGWTFEPQHWSVDVDIPLAGHATFAADFKTAVRQLLASTELGERPVQPCFYTNKVLRVVPFTQACDRSATSGARP